MLTNQKTNIIIASFAFLILVVLIFSRSGWIMLTARPVPSWDTQYPTPKPINDEEFRKMLPVPVSMEAWLGRLNSKKIPETQVAEWKTYQNKEYGFELQYPSTWEVREGESGTGPFENHKSISVVSIYFLKDASGEGASFVSKKDALLSIFKISLSGYFKLIPERNERLIEKGLTPDAVINGIKIIVDPARAGVDSAAFLPMLFEHNGIMYSFGMNEYIREDEIIEYMIKSFHFVR